MFNKVAIVGTGLIGGSLALAMRKKKLCREIIGISRHKQSLSLAKRMRAIDRASQDIKAIQDADLVILATPVNKIKDQALAISKIIKPGCLVTDVGSTKEEIVSGLHKIFPRFVGSHPLAGSEKRGIQNADPELFAKSSCILTPLKDTDKQAFSKIKQLWLKLGCRIIIMHPRAHDQILSYLSHLPHVAAFALINSIPQAYLRYPVNSLREVSRIAASDAQIWAEIFLSNSSNTLKAIRSLENNLCAIKSAILKQDQKNLVIILKTAKARRESLK